MPNWTYDVKARRYRGKDGRFLSHAKMLALRDVFIDKQSDVVNALAVRLAAREITLVEWERAMRQVVKDTYIAETLAAIGGRKMATPAIWGRVGYMIKEQYRYLSNFVNDILKKNLTPGQIATRARMYIRSATAAYEKGRLVAYGIMAALPQVPGDGQTECKVNCRCSLSIRETKSEWQIRWLLDPSCEHCRDCPRLSREWSPLVIVK